MADRSRWGTIAAGLGVATVAGALYATLLERNWFAIRRVTVPVLNPGAAPVRLLHLSDLHLTPNQRHKVSWVRALSELHPDLVVNTGDTLSHARSVPVAVRALGDLLDLPGAFVFGNNDYFSPRPKSPHLYFSKARPVPRSAPLPWRDLRAAQAEHGWIDLDNRHGTLTVRGQKIALAGVDDPHLHRDRYADIAGPADESAVVRIGVSHSPEPRVLDGFAGDGYDLVLAGHTHGGQVRIPGYGAIVTNSGIDRLRARGLSRWGAHMWLNVSAGLGSSPYMPIRFCCRPEAILLTLVQRPPIRSERGGFLG